MGVGSGEGRGGSAPLNFHTRYW